MLLITTVSEQTLDGKLSLGPGRSSKALFDFYGEDLRGWFHEQRAAHDAIMVGAGTVRSDDPELTVRYARGENPLRVTLSSRGDLPAESRLFNDGLPTLVALSARAPEAVAASLSAKPGVEVVRCGENRVDLGALMAVLETRGIKTLMVEGGSRLLHSLHAAGLVNRIIIKHIPVIAGAADAPSYLNPSEGSAPLALSRWRLTDLFAKSGVAVSIYQPMDEAT